MTSTRFCQVCGAANDETQARCFACGHELAEDIQAGSTAQGTLLHGRYRLGNTIGTGGYSAVYRGWDTQEGGRAVAIKQITLHGLGTEETIEATNTYNREIEALSTLNHPQVPRLYDHFSDQDHWYLVLEYIEGQTLESYLEARAAQNKPFQVEEVLNIGLQLCTVLSYLHSRHPAVVFRDLKPDNIMRTPSGKLYLVDFGIARHYTPGQSRDTQSLGSPGYAAPEQYGKAQSTPRTDLYGLGALLHQLLSGHDPSETPRALPPLRLNGQPGSAELEALVRHLLSSDPQDRPASAHDVAGELERIRHKRVSALDSQRIWQPPMPQNYPGQAPSQVQQHFHTLQQQTTLAQGRRLHRRRVLAGMGAGVVALGVGVGVYIWAQGQFSPAAQNVPVYTTYTGHSDTVSVLAWTPDGQRIASAANDGSVHIWDALSGEQIGKNSDSNSGIITGLAWAEDSQVLYFTESISMWMVRGTTWSAVEIWRGAIDITALAYALGRYAPYAIALGLNNGDVAVMAATDERAETSGYFTYYTSSVADIAYSPDGYYLAEASSATVVLWDVRAMKRVYATYQHHTDKITSVAWLPNGVYIASASADQTVHVWSAVTGATLFICRGHTATVRAVAPSPDGNYLASASDDTTVRIWNAYDGSLLMTYTGHTNPVTCVNWSPDGKYIASGSADKTVRVWSPPSFSS